MYFHYCLITSGTIFVIGLILFYIMKKNNQVNKKNNINLVVCTVLSMICTSTAPLLAKRLVKELSFSITMSLVIALIVVFGIAFVIFILLQPLIKKYSLKGMDESGENKDSLIEQILESSAQCAPTLDSTDMKSVQIPVAGDPATINEAAITKEIGTNNVIINIPEAQPKEPEKPETSGVFSEKSDQSDIVQLLNEAIELKNQRDFYGAISYYETALIMNPEDELRFLILLDLCALFKKTNQPESVIKILESTRCELLNLEKKEDILRNL